MSFDRLPEPQQAVLRLFLAEHAVTSARAGEAVVAVAPERQTRSTTATNCGRHALELLRRKKLVSRGWMSGREMHYLLTAAGDAVLATAPSA